MRAADVPPIRRAPVNCATTAESIAWSKWVCTGTTASRRFTDSWDSAASIRGRDDASGRAATVRRLGREKNPSVITAVLPSSTSSVVTPAQDTESGVVGDAGGRSKWAA